MKQLSGSQAGGLRRVGLLVQMAELEPTPQTPTSPFNKVQQMYNKLIDTVKAASPMHRGAGRTAFQRDTPSAKAGSGAVNLNASSR